jgi:hypothetical protein
MQSVSLNTAFGMAIKNLLETYDTTSTVKFNLMERTSLKIRHLLKAMDEEVISFQEQTAENLIIENDLEIIESAKKTTTTPHYVRTR